ncbi:Guanylate kinase (EC [Olavius algarvensis Delta 1 endosymbiont]|nr:Guanylate kinase (EC [Olavius algarvensis Delta 1 endosymbiont]
MSQGKSRKNKSCAATRVPVGTGHLFVLSAPSGAGKSTLCRALLDHFPDMQYSISHTTRLPRQGEQDGVHYYFIGQDQFKQGIEQGRWAEWAKVHDNFYGTSADLLDDKLNAGCKILLDIDVQGMRQILQRYPDAVTIFVMPPSLETLRTRLESRGTDSPEVIDVRLKNAQKEMAQRDRFRHIIINDQLADAIAQLIGIVEKYRS